MCKVPEMHWLSKWTMVFIYMTAPLGKKSDNFSYIIITNTSKLVAKAANLPKDV